MQEQIVGFEVAKLAKDKGFKERCLNFYFEDGELRENILNTTNGYYGEEVTFEYEDLIENWNDGYLTKKDGNRCFGCSKSKGYLETYSAPTQALLQKWLREKHNVHIAIKTGYDGTFIITIYNMNKPQKANQNFYEYSAYEEALEAGLLKALKLIIKL